MWIVYRQRRSIAVADVPDAPLSTVMGAGLIPLAEPLTAQFPLTLLLLHDLQCNGTEFRGGSEDAVLIEFHGLFAHGSIVQGQQWGMGQAADTCSGVTRHQRERCFGATLPNDAGLAPCFGDPLCRLQVAGIVCPMLIEFAPCLRLNSVHA